jgi:hypothetical protein
LLARILLKVSSVTWELDVSPNSLATKLTWEKVVVEGYAVAVPFGIAQNSVTVKDQSLYLPVHA